MTTAYSLRDVEVGDIEWLYELNEDSYRDVIIRQFGEWDENFQRQWFEKKWDGRRPAKVLMIKGEPAGVFVLQRRADHDWLDEILIGPDFRDRGIGTAVMWDLIADARVRERRLRLRVLTKNYDAKRFYERLGFQVFEKLEQHYVMEITPSLTGG